MRSNFRYAMFHVEHRLCIILRYESTNASTQKILAIQSYDRKLLQSITFQIQVLHTAHFRLIGFGLILVPTKVEGTMEDYAV